MPAQICIVGNLGGDAETKRPGDTDLCEFSVAVSNGPDTEPTWFRCTFWGEYAHQKAKHLKKGVAVTVGGSLKVSTYTNKAGYDAQSLDVRAAFVTPHQWQQEDGGATPKTQEQLDDDIPF